ncbi:MAG: DUF4097 family beta strand repeat protein [Chloroflexi bacterium]|uniref:DUF4097 domain-containing protein n=1 Tax=Candidatus Chlorohelix allophototropha TaxID=3003348 RepID=A0A8T7LZ14_9CHLR|nr:DUF4097 family beta strand repeat protein [Chloroflexota bacterium]WJW66499.1 DUF4097 domain-containing protein [Chloroflexota bacterium L227-S17]
MHRVVVPILLLFLLAEISGAVAIVMTAPGGFKGLVTLDIGDERRVILPDETFNINPGATLDIQSGNGTVQVTGDSTATQVTVHATKVTRSLGEDAFDRISYSAKIEGNNLVIRANPGSTFTFGISFGESRVDLAITAPSNLLNRIKTNNGAILVTNFNTATGNQSLGTDNGRITVKNLVAQRLELTSSNGSINLDGVTATLSAQTNNGRIEAINSTLGIEQVNSDNGSISLSGALSQVNSGSVQSSNGSVRFSFKGTSDKASYEIRTDNGSINFNIPGLSVRRENNNKTLFSNNNAPNIKIKTNNGSVTVE